MKFLVQANQPIGHRAFVEGSVDTQNNPIETWAAAVPRMVFGWGPPAPEDEIRNDRDVIIESQMVLSPDADWLDPRDRIVLAGVEYEVHGGPRDFTHGPFNFAPGYAIQVKRAVDIG
ncbi:hypothetical protein [Paeniglutamicibacter terrestris]|uniref:Head-tail adaptor protein n=1 Tax=Paeniglutamicibacter terrestris TaxID=2723403 RepID=A0ABX1G5W4_9MICC|nr:hypothetical protein [Paeniglutamicibacter terrestris]NKG21106.1 hypothetical protein [Paeniglutamicibacter terrestris]